MPEEFDLWLIKESLKFDYSFTTLIFATLALSIQFSPGMGFFLPWALISSWAFLMVAAIAGGNRVIRKEIYYRNNHYQNKAKQIGEVEAVQKAQTILDDEQKKSLVLYKIRQWGFLAGVFLNFIFVVVNYLEKSCAVSLGK